MKRNKHILINLTDEQYNALLLVANTNRRKLADMAFIMLIDELEKELINITDKKTEFKKMIYINE